MEAKIDEKRFSAIYDEQGNLRFESKGDVTMEDLRSISQILQRESSFESVIANEVKALGERLMALEKAVNKLEGKK